MGSLSFASSLEISSSSAGTAIIVAIRIRTGAPFEALRESTVSPEFQIIHGSWTKRLLYTLPPSAATVIIVIREETMNVYAVRNGRSKFAFAPFRSSRVRPYEAIFTILSIIFLIANINIFGKKTKKNKKYKYAIYTAVVEEKVCPNIL